MDKELEKIHTTKAILDRISPTFCAVKWKHATINMAFGTVKSCCHQSFRQLELSHNESKTQFHDTALDRKERKQMLKGQRPQNCASCWWPEDHGQWSDRVLWSSKSWMSPYIEEIAQEKSENAQRPSWLELNFSNVCNLKCSYCSPLFSTNWSKEIIELGPYPTVPPYNNIEHLEGFKKIDSPKNEQMRHSFWHWFEKIYSDLRLLKLTGGEPLLSEETFRLFELVTKKPNFDMNFAINSNVSVSKGIFDRLLNFVTKAEEMGFAHKFCLHPSVDAFGEKAEYIRHGLNFNLFKSNIEAYLAHPHVHLVFICTINNLSLSSLRELWEYLLYLKKKYGNSNRNISISTEMLLSPEWQNIDILPASFQSYVQETIAFVETHMGNDGRGFTEFEKKGLERVLEMMKKSKKSKKETAEIQKNFFLFFSEHDRRRNTDLLKCFPEFSMFWNDCQNLLKA